MWWMACLLLVLQEVVNVRLLLCFVFRKARPDALVHVCNTPGMSACVSAWVHASRLK